MKRTCIILIAIVLTLVIAGIWFFYKNDIKEYYQTKDLIHWQNSNLITSNDFEASVNKSSKLKIYWWHGLILESDKRKVRTAKAYAIFDKSKSWIKDTSNYEFSDKMRKLNFDLYEAYARVFNDSIDKLRFDEYTTYEDLELIGDELYEELKSHQKIIYDSYTDNEERYTKWRPIIDSLLLYRTK
ncbi:hypothetical protein [Patiriisocius sp. Uisw_017]|uniref:hypothetical protein n=1 Tax=Patiriisocius sp. Uisw_017 TaxID=3230968 RepID=UPI0039EB0DAD